MTTSPSAAAPRAHFLALLERFSSGMLVTHAQDGCLHARPMVLARTDAAGDVWLLSDVHAEKVAELTRDARVGVTLQDGPRFVALSGTCEVQRDVQLARQLWRPSWAQWFPHGPDHPDTVLLVVRSTTGQYWDHGGGQPAHHVLEAATPGRPLLP